MRKTLAILLLALLVVGCKKNEQAQRQPREERAQNEQQQSEEQPSRESQQGAQQPSENIQQEAAPAAQTPTADTVKKQMPPDQLGLADPVVNSIGMKLALIPAGEFQMGSQDSDSDATDREKPRHRVKITKPFYVSVYEVTQQQYVQVMDALPWQGKDYVTEGADYPATYVRHDEAVEFCRRLSKQEGVQYRLPTEAQWEYACRGGTTTIYSFGDDAATLGQYAWYRTNAWDIGEKYGHRVGQKLPNPWGLYDMHGNVYEWCQDWYARYGNEKVVSDPIPPAQGDVRLLRGGAFNYPAKKLRSASRNIFQPDYRSSDFGFRVTRTYGTSP